MCKEAVLPVLAGLLQDEDVEIQINAAGAIMNTVIIPTGGAQHCVTSPDLSDASCPGCSFCREASMSGPGGAACPPAPAV